MKVGIIGRKTIGSALQERLRARGDEVVFTYHTQSKKPYEQVLHESKVDGIYLAISTTDQGEAAKQFILTTVQQGIPIVTCEKGSFSFHADALLPHIELIGYRASVCGGVAVLPYLKLRHLNGCPVEIQAVLNGALNFIFHKVQQGSTYAEACMAAEALRFVEPGATDSVSIVEGEITDLIMKISVFYNTTLSKGRTITPSQLTGGFTLSSSELRYLNGCGVSHRFIVTFSNVEAPDYIYFGNKSIQVSTSEGWHISAGLREITQQDSWLPHGEWNGVQLTEGDLGSDGKYELKGPGAGPGPTTKAMVDDMDTLLEVR